MPKKLEELKSFSPGIISSPSVSDIPKEAASYSLNIDANAELGALKGIKESKVLSQGGWRDKRYTEYTLDVNSGLTAWATVVTHLTGRYLILPAYDKTYFVWFHTTGASSYEQLGAIEHSIIDEARSIYPDLEERKISNYSTVATFVISLNSFLNNLASPDSESYMYQEIDPNYFTMTLNNDDYLTSDTASIHIKSNYLGTIAPINFNNPIFGSDFSEYSIDGTYFELKDAILGSGTNTFKRLNWAESFNRDKTHSLLSLDSDDSFGVFDNIYSTANSFKVIQNNVLNSGKNNITSEQRNNNVYIGLGSNFDTKSKWFGKIKRKQLNRNLDGDFLEDLSLKSPNNLNRAFGFDKIVVPTLNKYMSSANSMIAGAASLYCGGTVGTDFGGADVDADATINDYRSLNGWVMKCLANAGHAFQSDWSAATDDGHFDWAKSCKRGMILRVSIGDEGDATCFSVKQDSSLGAPAAGEALYELRRIKEIGFADTSAVTASAEGSELHDGDLFQIVTVPSSGADTLNDSGASSSGNVVTYPRLMYVGSLSGNSTVHNSSTADIPAPAWAYGAFNDSSELHRIALSECNDSKITSTESVYTFSEDGATGETTSESTFLNRTTSIDLQRFISTSEFAIGTISECMSVDGDGGIAGRTGEIKQLTINAVDRCDITGTPGTTNDVDDYVRMTTTASHGYITGDWVTISNSTNHDGTWQITKVIDATKFVIHSGSVVDTDDSANVISANRNYYAGHGKLWVTSSNPDHWNKLWLVDVLNWHLLDADNLQVTVKEFELDFSRIHNRLISGADGEGLIEETYFDKDWVDKDWTNRPKGFIGSICETYSHRPHLDDGAYKADGVGRWRVWIMYCKQEESENNKHSNWDLFLFNFRPTDLKDTKNNKAYMYDKTPPYQECGRYASGGGVGYFPRDKFMITRQVPSISEIQLGDGTTVNGSSSQRKIWKVEDTNYPGANESYEKYYIPAGEIRDTRNQGTDFSVTGGQLRYNGGHHLVKDDLQQHWDSVSPIGRPPISGESLSMGASEDTEAATQGGAMFKDPSGMWHFLELPFYRGDVWYDRKAVQHGIHLGYNIGWYEGRGIGPTRHCLIPYFSEWFKTTDIAVEENSGTTNKDVSHIVTFACNVTGDFVRNGGNVYPLAGTGTQGLQWSVSRGELHTYDDTVCLMHMHDSPVAFTSSDTYGNIGGENDSVSDLDGVTDWSGSGGVGIDEVQGRPTKADNDAGTADVYTRWDTDNGVKATLGYSKFNQYRWGHDYNGTKDLDDDTFDQTANPYNTYKSYIGQDGYGHYNMVTTSWCSVNEDFAVGQQHNSGTAKDLFKTNRMRVHNASWNFQSAGALGHTFSGSPGIGTGYFTWYANTDSISGSSVYADNEVDFGGNWPPQYWQGIDRGWYSNSAYVNKNDAALDTNNIPPGTQWQNRKIVKCWSVIPNIVGLKQNGDSDYVKAPRVMLRKVDGYTNYVADGEYEKEPINEIYALDNLHTYYTGVDASFQKYLSGVMIYGSALIDEGGNTNQRKSMTIAAVNSHLDSNHSTASEIARKPFNSMRPLLVPGVSELARRVWNNTRIVGKNLAHSLFTKASDATYDIYCPIIWGNNQDNTQSIINIYRRATWPTMATSDQGTEEPHYSFDKFYDFYNDGDSDSFGGFDNAGSSNLLNRFPTEALGSHMGTNTGTSDTVSGDNDDAGCHKKSALGAGVTTTSNAGTSAEFSSGDIIEYKFSYLYDGFQDSPLTNWSHKHNGGSAIDGNVESVKMVLGFGKAEILNLSRRVTDLIIWRRNNKFDAYRFVSQINFNDLAIRGAENDIYEVTITDDKAGEIFENISGFNQTLTDIDVNFSLSTQVLDFMFVGNCYHKKIKDAENMIFRSKPGKFSIYDWSNDFLSLPTRPLALASFNGKLFAFGREKLFRINPEQFFIESVMDGIGVINQNSVVVTDYGMFFCDANSMYMHNGSKPVDIGAAVRENQDNVEWSVGYRRALEKAVMEGYEPLVQYDGKNKCVYFIVQGYSEGISSYDKTKSRAYAYSFETGRFDYVQMPPIQHTLLGRDGDTLLADGYQIYSFRRSQSISQDWSWNSKEFDMGSLAVNKVWKSIKLAGSPTLLNMDNLISDDVRVYVDGVQQKMKIENKNYVASKPIASSSATQNWNGNSDADSTAIYALSTALPGNGETTNGLTNADSFSLLTSSMPEFVSGEETVQNDPITKGEIETLKYISKGQYLFMEINNDATNKKLSEIVKVSDIYFYWNEDKTIKRVEVKCERNQLGTSSVDFETSLNTDNNWKHSSIRYVGPSLKFPGGTKGKTMQIKLQNQKGTVDSMSFIYRLKTLK